MPPLLSGRLLFVENRHKGDRHLCGGGDELDVVVIVERHVNGHLYRISSGLAGLVVLGMPSLDDAKTSTLSLIPSLV